MPVSLVAGTKRAKHLLARLKVLLLQKLCSEASILNDLQNLADSHITLDEGDLHVNFLCEHPTDCLLARRSASP